MLMYAKYMQENDWR